MIRLIALDDVALGNLLDDVPGALSALASNGAEVRDFFEPLLVHSRTSHRQAGSSPPWHGYLAVESARDRLVGICSFEGNPDAAGEVEISYGTVPKHEGRGYATEMAGALLGIAFAAPEVRRVVAHTLPVPNAPTRVLHRLGFRKTGAIIDPEDGRMWRWELPRPE